MRLKDKVCFITGASRGIGRGIALAFAKEGAKVVIGYHSNDELAKVVKNELDTLSGTENLTLKIDVSDIGSINNAFNEVIKSYNKLDVLVNNAGYLKQQELASITEEDWDRSIDVNLKGTFFCTKNAFQIMQKQTKGTVINMTSVGGQIGGTKAPHYSAAKAGVISLTKSFARLGAINKIRVNAIAPGYVNTDMYKYILTKRTEEEILAEIPLGRVAEIADISKVAVFLASSDSSYITGQVLNVNGGVYV
jgi:3-oxoacyl-[acyl-carrier protein] reductase